MYLHAANCRRALRANCGWSSSFYLRLLLLVMVVLGALFSARADTIILHLKNGDRIAGTIILEDTNRVVITNSWIKELSVPLSEIAGRETPPAAPAPAPATETKPAVPAPETKPPPVAAEVKPAPIPPP